MPINKLYHTWFQRIQDSADSGIAPWTTDYPNSEHCLADGGYLSKPLGLSEPHRWEDPWKGEAAEYNPALEQMVG